MDVQKLKRERHEVEKRAQALCKTWEERADNSVTPEEDALFKELRAKLDDYDAQVRRAEEVEAIMKRNLSADNSDAQRKEQNDRAATFGEFVRSFINDPYSPRVEGRNMTLAASDVGGVLVPPEFDSTIRAVTPDDALIRPRATVVPAGSAAPDAPFMVPVFNQSGDKGVYGAVTMRWPGEVGTRQNAGNLQFEHISYTPNPVTGFIDVSRTLLDNSKAAGLWIEQQMRAASIAEEERAFLVGTGTLQPLGFVGHPCNKKVARKAANSVSYADIVEMMAHAYGNSTFVWIASRTILPILMQIKDDAGNLIWQPDAKSASPGTLMGYPVYFSTRVPPKGEEGDLMLVDLSKYLIKDGTGMRLLQDPYTLAGENKVRIYFSFNVDGKPWLSTPILDEDNITRSPFVCLSGAA